VQRYNQSNSIPFTVFLDQNKLFYTRLKMTGGIGLYIFNKTGKNIIASKLGSYTSQEVNLTENWRAFASNYCEIWVHPCGPANARIQPPLPVFAAKDLSGSMVDSKRLSTKKGPAVGGDFSPKCRPLSG